MSAPPPEPVPESRPSPGDTPAAPLPLRRFLKRVPELPLSGWH